MPAPLDDPALREVWRRLGMAGDFDVAMRRPAVRRAIEAAARALHLRRLHRLERRPAPRRQEAPPRASAPPTRAGPSPDSADD